jgi:hypothetical protein
VAVSWLEEKRFKEEKLNNDRVSKTIRPPQIRIAFVYSDERLPVKENDTL